MNEEEKKAINNMKLFARVHQDMTVVTAKEMDTVLNLVEKLQKENEELKQKLNEEQELNKIIKETKLNQLLKNKSY